MIQRWVKKSKDHPRAPFPGNGVQVERDVEFAQLRRELGRVREERDILKKAIAIFSERRQ
jgi:transposase